MGALMDADHRSAAQREHVDLVGDPTWSPTDVPGVRPIEAVQTLQVRGQPADVVDIEPGTGGDIVTRIRATCPMCGEVDLRPDEVVLHVVRDLDGEVSDLSSYRFDCPDCAESVVKPADGRIADLLTTGGVPIEEGDAQAARQRPPHPEAPRPGPVLTHDDLLDLHLALETDDWFATLLTSSS
jgi:predicted RNA-binding Zn-ribbon protein involved in translation (DUF1610 family)